MNATCSIHTHEMTTRQGGSVQLGVAGSVASIIPRVTICALTYGDYPQLIRRLIESIQRHCSRSEYRLVVGANAACSKTLDYLQGLEGKGEIDRLIVSALNLNKNPMMRRMFERIETEFIWWFDDDSYITEPGACARWLQHASAAPDSTALWGEAAYCGHRLGFSEVEDVLAFVRSAAWYRGLPPPSWQPGGKGEFNFENRGTGDGRWIFVVGGCWLIRTQAVRAIDWPDPRLIKLGDDVFLGEAIRQQGWDLADMPNRGIAINTESRRGETGYMAAI
jgi:hypothetical protein